MLQAKQNIGNGGEVSQLDSNGTESIKKKNGDSPIIIIISLLWEGVFN